MQSLGGSSRPLLAEASALYQELDTLRSWHPIFPSTAPAGQSNAPVTSDDVLQRRELGWGSLAEQHARTCTMPSSCSSLLTRGCSKATVVCSTQCAPLLV